MIRDGDTVLLARARGYANTFLPGGHLDLGESLPVSLVRELREELGLEARVGAYLGTIEHGYNDNKATHYELNHIFEVALPPRKADVVSHEAHLDFFWAELSELVKYQLEPYPLRELLRANSSVPFWASTLTLA